MVIRNRRWTINILLFIATTITTTVVGAFYANERYDEWFRLSFLLSGWVFSVPLMSILVVHEMGHYLTGRRRYMDVTPPYFIPAPPPLGTFGAFIKIRSPIFNRSALVEVGASGPVAGSIVAIPLLVVGLLLSEFRPQLVPTQGFSFGSSMILELLCLAVYGDFSSSSTVLLHPTAMAAWFGLFVTAMNLLPIGQLDGGHVVYGLFGSKAARVVSFVAFLLLLPLAFLWPGWLMFALLVLVLGLRHPPPIDPESPPTRSARILGWVAVVLFIVTFIPVPIGMPE